ncbi:MAG2960 family serine endopeptidase lipoprotein [Mycoplasma feriruminatoris]|uniref:MAG2960 family serine endopeptidase lipoprotein n=1 Tax=Mycoplasma feriruminatoris TaxID=1179777 RepID=UPI00241F2F51|nr:DUF31 family protein [Mycoplasma feriruminatoris]WFQ89828.1 hypothetical protein MFERI11561_00047 [Mycoplasma feriruminatoris]
MNKFTSKLKFLLLLNSIVFPTILTISCSRTTSNKPEQNNNDNRENNQNNSNNQQDQNNQSEYANLYNSHFLDINDLLKSNPYEIHKKTKDFIKSEKEFNKFLTNNNIDFTFNDHKEYNQQYWEFASKLGEYGNIGNNKVDRTKFYNPNIPLSYSIKQQKLEELKDEEIKDLAEQTFDFTNLIKTNPFGFLPSNLSQLLSYASFSSLEKMFNLNDITSLKSKHDDINGTFELLITTKDNKYYYKVTKDKNNALKTNDDFFKYIHDRSFQLEINVKQWVIERDEKTYEEIKRLNFANASGTAWVIDRIKNDEDKENYELLLATNIHVFNLRNTFDKSIFNNKIDDKWKEFPVGFYDGKDTKNTNDNRQMKIYLKANRTEKIDNKEGLVETDVDASKSVDAFEIYSQYLTAPYYIPRYNTSNFYFKNSNKMSKYLVDDGYFSKTNNSGADFVTLRLKIEKERLKKLLPSLDKVINTNQEKDWYIKFNKNKFSPLQTQFYAGYPKHWNPFYRRTQFRGLKSEGGIVSSQRKILEDIYFRDIWLKYDKLKNMEYNSLNKEWEKYEKPFIDNEHGMKLTIADQFSTLYTNIPFGQIALKQGASGSMVIDSSFNVIGILNTEVEDVPGSKYISIPLFQYQDQTFTLPVRVQTNGVVLFNSLSNDYSNNKAPKIIDGLIDKLKQDNLKTINLNP